MDSESNRLLGEVMTSLEKSFADRLKDEQGDASFFVSTCGQIIRMMYSSAQEAARAKASLRKFLVPDGDIAASSEGGWVTFKHWSDNFEKILPEKYVRDGTRIFSNDICRLRVIMRYLISCVDYEHRIYYYCTETDRPFIGAHAMVNPFFLWGLENNLLFTHSACVGCDGRGVLLAADGGGGKSTLAVSCLMQGMDFVSDDYTLITGEGILKGMPVYSETGLTPESYDMLKPPYPVHWINEANRDKKFMDIAKEACFCDSIEIGALVSPLITGGRTQIYEIDARPVVMKFYQSSVKQVLGVGNREYLLKFMERMKGLKAYRLELGTDVIYNAQFLRDFIKGDLGYVQIE